MDSNWIKSLIDTTFKSSTVHNASMETVQVVEKLKFTATRLTRLVVDQCITSIETSSSKQYFDDIMQNKKGSIPNLLTTISNSIRQKYIELGICLPTSRGVVDIRTLDATSIKPGLEFADCGRSIKGMLKRKLQKLYGKPPDFNKTA
jgi:hypothetical protein